MTLPIAAVVVSYDSAPDLGACLRSLAAAGIERRVVVDNGSSDGSGAAAATADPGHEWIDSGANLGFGRAANLGAAASAEPYLLIGNADLVVDPAAPATLLERLRAEDGVGLVGPRLVNPDGSTYPSARTFPNLVDAIGHGLLGIVAPSNPFTRRYRVLDRDDTEAPTVDWVSGACFLVERRAFVAVGGFDPAYFMYLEDVDLCWRLRRAGWATAYEPAASVLHVQGASAHLHPYRMLAAHHRSLWRFATATTTGPRRAVLPVVGAGLVARLAVTAAAHRLAPGTRPARTTGPHPPRRVP